MDDLLGQIYGSYRLVRLIGSGGFATVYQGEHILLNIKVAVKVLGRLEPHETERFLQEAKIIADLHHPNIIRLLDFAIQDGRPFLCDGVCRQWNSSRPTPERGHPHTLSNGFLH